MSQNILTKYLKINSKALKIEIKVTIQNFVKFNTWLIFFKRMECDHF
jgi:hypothetical protein